MFSGPRPAAGLRVLLYHSVGSVLPSDPYGISMPEARFAEHVGKLKQLRERLIPAPFSAPADEAPRLSVTFDDGFKDALLRAAPLLCEAGLSFTVFMTSGFLDEGSGLYLCAADLRELSRLKGASIGAHGAAHRKLTLLSDGELREELVSSRARLEDVLGLPVRALSYPHGAVDRRVRAAAAAAGYELGGCSRYGANLPGRDPLLLCRTEITSFDSPEDFELKVLGNWDWFRLRRADPASTGRAGRPG